MVLFHSERTRVKYDAIELAVAFDDSAFLIDVFDKGKGVQTIFLTDSNIDELIESMEIYRLNKQMNGEWDGKR